MQTRFTHEGGKVSGTKTLLSVFVVAVMIRYVLGGVTIGHFSVGPWDGAGSAEVIGVLGMLYGGRRFTEAWVAMKTGAPLPPEEKR